MKLSVLFIGLILCNLICAQQLNFTNYSVSDGLAQSQIYAILPTKKGKLYLGTQGGGISIFDGKKFVTIRKENGLISNKVNAFFAQDQLIFIGTDKGVSLIKNQEIVSNIPTTKAVTCFFKVKNQIYVGTTSGLFIYSNNKLTQTTNQQLINKYITGYFVDGKNNLWITTQKGCWHITNSFKNLGVKNGWPSEYITSAAQNEEGIYLSTLANGIISLDLSLQRKETPPIFSNLIVNNLFLDENKQLWISTQNNGVYIYAKNKIEQYTTQQGLANNHVKCVTEDLWGNTWIGTSGGGISKYNPTDFVHYNTFSGLNGDYIYTVFAEKDDIWVSTANGGIVKLNDTLNKRYTNFNNKKIGKVRNLISDKNKNIWFTEEKVGLGKIDSYTDSIHYYSGNNSSNWILDFDIAQGGTLWLATADKGLLKASENLVDSVSHVTFYKYNHINQHLSNRIELVKIAPDNSIWIVDAQKGIAHFTGKELNFIKSSNKLNVRTIAFLNTQPVVGTDNGIYVVSKNEIHPASFNQVLTSENIYQLLVENDTTLWVGTEKGVDRVLQSKANTRVKHFGYKEGFRGVETSLGSAFKDNNDNLWFGTIRGLEKYAPSDKRKKRIAPLLYLKDIKIAYEALQNTNYSTQIKTSINETDSIVLPYYKTQIEFELSAFDLSATEDLRYSYKLAGLDERWSPPTNRNNIVFTSIPPGKYMLYYKAGNENVWTNTRQIYIEITPPYYTTWWFLAVCFLFFIGLIGMLFYLSRRRLKQKNANLKEKLSLERNLVELEQKALRLQMNPHFIFNVLQSIQEQIITDDKNKARLSIAKFAKLMREILENSREKFISLEQELQTVENYLKLEQLTKTVRFTYSIKIDDAIDDEEAIIPPLLIQPFAENAIIHGFKNMDRPPHLSINIELETENTIKIIIEDNGCGRQKSQTNKAQVDHLHKSLALQVTQERLSQLSREKSEKPLFEIIDKNLNGSPTGTLVVLRIAI